MNSSIKKIIYVALTIVVTAVIAIIWFVRSLSAPNQESVSEIPVTSEYLDSMRAAGFPISIRRAVSVSSYGGWHGDGQTVTAYGFPHTESDVLIAALKQKHPDFSWSETRSEFVARYSPWTLLPRQLQPESGSSVLLVGRAKEGLPIQEYAIDRSHGTLYSVSNRF